MRKMHWVRFRFFFSQCILECLDTRFSSRFCSCKGNSGSRFGFETLNLSLLWSSVLWLCGYLVGTGTSVRPVSSTAGDRRMKAMIGRSRKSTSPTRTLEASAPGGIFFMKFISTWNTHKAELHPRSDITIIPVTFPTTKLRSILYNQQEILEKHHNNRHLQQIL